MAPMACNRMVALGVLAFVLCALILASLRHPEQSIQKIKEAAHSAASSAQENLCSDDSPLFAAPTFQKSIAALYEGVKHPITTDEYKDLQGTTFNVSDNHIWKEPLGKDVLIVDMDTRIPDGEASIFGKETINWENVPAEGEGLLTASFLNHFLYAQIHGYDYKFYHANEMEDHHNTWIKPHVLDELLHSYRFVVFIDADATINHLEIPLEWMFNRWGITENTSIAMPIDTKQILNGDREASMDSKGKVELNTGFVVAQSMPYTFEMLNAWKTCTKGTRYPKCKIWSKEWSHEQRAFSEHIRYDFNPDGNNIVEIPCDDAMGYPGLHQDHPHILSDCTGQFVRHHTIDKSFTKRDVRDTIMQSMAQIMQATLLKDKSTYIVTER